MSGEGAGRVEVRAQIACFDDGRLLCARHRKAGDAYLVLPGGHVEPGESVAEAARREMEEETGVALVEPRLWAVSEFLSSRRHVVDLTFYAVAWEGDARLGTDPDAEDHPASLVGLEWLDSSRLGVTPFRPAILRDHLLRHWAEPGAPCAYLGAERA